MVTYQALHIPEPCTKVHYDDLPYDPNKRPCHLCEKPVYDFRNKDAAFLKKVWNEHQGDFCGAFRHNQFDEVQSHKPFNSLQLFKRSITTFYLYLVTLFASPAKAQEQASSTSPIEQVTAPSNDSNSVRVHAKECRSCEEKFHITLSINEAEYGSYWITADTLEIKLPPTIKPTDQIKISGLSRKMNRGWKMTVLKRKEIVVAFGNQSEIEVKMTRKKRLRLIYKRDFIGCPKFR